MSRIHELWSVRRTFSNWPQVTAASLLWKHLGLPKREMTLSTRAGSRITAPLVRNVGALYTALDIFAFSAYECDWELEREPFILDIGSNIGGFALWLAQERPRLRGICYEPDPEAYRYLKTNLGQNGLHRVEPRRAAISDRTGTELLFRSSPGDGASSLRSTSHVTQFTDRIEVPLTSFEDVMSEIREEVDLLKIDCEGAEFDIVLNSPPTSWRGIKKIVIEFHPVEGFDKRAIREKLAAVGFGVVKERVRSEAEGTLWFSRDDR